MSSTQTGSPWLVISEAAEYARTSAKTHTRLVRRCRRCHGAMFLTHGDLVGPAQGWPPHASLVFAM
jgi:hypothetical protein